MKEYEAALWLSGELSISAGVKNKLFLHFGSSLSVFNAGKEEFIESGILKEDRVKALLKGREAADPSNLSKKLSDRGIGFTYIGAKDYPARLRNINDAPFGLYYKGDLSVTSKNCVAIVGARRCSGYGRSKSRKIAGELSDNGIVVISGMAGGIDGEAHRGVMESGGSTVAVLGCGVDICYPASNRDIYDKITNNGCLISEYAPGTAPRPIFFPERNRIISGLSEAVLVIEARHHSGSLITANLALSQNRDVWALPGRVEDPLSHG
ncbi:MAG: DNA-processing protein DprA, partial [Lachnospiraceae bacterium]|nr:DNA-processing protein DprA [Lachnospiraceae bacterium]